MGLPIGPPFGATRYARNQGTAPVVCRGRLWHPCLFENANGSGG